jgi:hypothetical protein
MSAPTIWIPKSWKLKLSAIDDRKNKKSAKLSPVQWKPNLFVPKVELRLMIKGLLFLLLRNKLVL